MGEQKSQNRGSCQRPAWVARHETAADAKQKVSEFGHKATDKINESRSAAAGALDKAAGQLTDAAPSAADKVKAAAEYVRQTELKAMSEDVKGISEICCLMPAAAPLIILGTFSDRPFRSSSSNVNLVFEFSLRRTAFLGAY